MSDSILVKQDFKSISKRDGSASLYSQLLPALAENQKFGKQPTSVQMVLVEAAREAALLQEGFDQRSQNLSLEWKPDRPFAEEWVKGLKIVHFSGHGSAPISEHEQSAYLLTSKDWGESSGASVLLNGQMIARHHLTTQNWQDLLGKKAATDRVFEAEEIEAIKRWAAANPITALAQIRQTALHGRVRWLVLEILAKQPTDELRDTLVSLLETPDLDPWLLNGVPAVIRFVPMLTYRERTRRALAAWLQRAHDDPDQFTDHRRRCALGELLMTFGSFAEPGDIALLGGFNLGAWPLKPLVNAADATARTARRHCQSAEVEQFFQRNAEDLGRRGSSLLELRSVSADNGALLLSWIDLMVARLGEEGAVAVNLIRERGSNALKKRTGKAIADAASALRRRDAPEWIARGSQRAESWLATLAS